MLRILLDVNIDKGRLAALTARPDFELRVVPFAESVREFPRNLIEDIDVLFCTYPPSNFTDMRQVRWIQIASSGYTQLFPHHLPARKIRATNARGCFDVPIAEWNIAMMVNLIRDLPQMNRNQQAQVWDRSARFSQELRGMTVGLWGYGGLARETARMAKLMGLHIHVLARHSLKPALDVYRVPETGDPEGILPDRTFFTGSEPEFLNGLDFLVLAMPLTMQTEGIVGDKELQALPSKAFVLNPARGPLIKEQSLLRALREGWIAGAAIDTHYHYPLPSDHPLWSFSNVILTPHISGTNLTPIFQQRVWDIFTQNLDRYLNGRTLLNELSSEQLQGM